MPDREKVIKGLEKCLNPNLNCYHDDIDCPYAEQCWLSDSLPTRPLKEDALELLKEHREVKPKRDANCVKMFHCGSCGEYVGFIDSDPGDTNEKDNYCRNCGRKVKWE